MNGAREQNLPYYERRRRAKQRDNRPVPDSRLIKRAVPYRSQLPPPVAPAPAQFVAPVMWVPVVPVQTVYRSNDAGAFFGGTVFGGALVAFFAVLLAIVI